MGSAIRATGSGRRGGPAAATHRAYGLTWAMPFAFAPYDPAEGDAPADVTVVETGVPLSEGSPLGMAGVVVGTPRVGGMRIAGGASIEVERHPECTEEALRLMLMGQGAAVVLHQRGALPLHGSAVLTDGGAVLLLGHSGVGKSTVNALVPDAHRATGVVNAVTGRGRHTSSSTVSLRLPGGGWIIDTPGVRSFGLGHVDPDNILRAFGDLAVIGEQCPRGCTHLPDAPDCAIVEAAASGELGDFGAERLDSLQRLLTTLAPGAGRAGADTLKG